MTNLYAVFNSSDSAFTSSHFDSIIEEFDLILLIIDFPLFLINSKKTIKFKNGNNTIKILIQLIKLLKCGNNFNDSLVKNVITTDIMNDITKNIIEWLNFEKFKTLANWILLEFLVQPIAAKIKINIPK